MASIKHYFTDIVTVYHKTIDPSTKRDVLTRVIVPGVMVRQKVDRVADASGILRTTKSLSLTLLPETDPDTLLAVGDLVVVGIGHALDAAYTLSDLKRDHPELCTVQGVTDNRNKPYLQHRKAVCQ